jgi:hypothetical protein
LGGIGIITVTLYVTRFFFSRKEAKAVVLLRRRLWTAQTSAKRPWGFGAFSQRIIDIMDVQLVLKTLLFPEKEAKSVSSAPQKDWGRAPNTTPSKVTFSRVYKSTRPGSLGPVLRG